MIAVAVVLAAVAASTPAPADLSAAAVRYCQYAGCSRRVEVEVVAESDLPRGKVATTTVVWGRCRLSFTAESAERPIAVAHEACHCALDGDVIGPYGYEVPEAEARAREAKVKICARNVLTKGRR